MTTISLRRVLALIMVFAILCSSFLVLDRRSSALEPIRSGLNEIVSPISSTFYQVVDRPTSDSELERQLAEITAERDALLAENSQLKADTVELAQLQQQLEVENENPDLDLTRARVINRDPTGAQMFLIIDVGSDDGVRAGMAILSPNYFIGQVTEVSPQTSKVMLIIDGSQSVGAMLEDTRGDGIVQGQWQQGGYLSMVHVQPDKAPKEGEWVVTSESSETQTRQVPPNILIGKVMGEPVVDAQTDLLTINLRPGISDFNDLTVVYVAVTKND